MSVDRIWADFNEFDPSRRVIPLSKRSVDDFEQTGQKLREGAVVRLYMEDLNDASDRDDLIAEGLGHFDTTLGRWFAVALGEIRHASELKTRPRAEELIG